MKQKRLITGNVIVLAICLAFYFIVPQTANNYVMTVANTVLIYFLGSIGISLLMGMGGHLSFASISFMGISAFTTAQLSKNFGMSTVASVLVAVLITTVASLIIGMMILRLSGSFFLFATIAFAQIMANIFLTMKSFSGGGDGIYNIPKLNAFGFEFTQKSSWFYLLGAVAILVALIVERIRKTVLGRSLMSIRDNEIAAQTLGVNVYRTKVIAFVIASSFAALGGALLALQNGAVSASLFTLEISQRFMVMVMLGGVNSTIGTFIGTLIVTTLPEVLRPVQQYLNIIFGVGLVLMMVYMPMGLTGMVQEVKNKILRTYRKRKEVPADGGSAQG